MIGVGPEFNQRSPTGSPALQAVHIFKHRSHFQKARQICHGASGELKQVEFSGGLWND
jgi:hypothetical protein